MKSLSKKYKEEWQFFINPMTKKVQFNVKCNTCVHECKQSYKAKLVVCKFYQKFEELKLINNVGDQR